MSNNSVNLPNYESVFYQEIKEKLNFCDDMYEGRSAWMSPLEGIYDIYKASRYLPKENEEPADQYYKRICNSYFHNLYKDAIHSTVGFLDFTLNDDVLESILEHKDNIDGKGNSIEVFFEQADVAALKHGFCFILIDYPSESPSTLYEAKQMGRRPYFVLVERTAVPNGKVYPTFQPKANPLERLTMKQVLLEDDGLFGEKLVTQYRVIGNQWYQEWKEDENKVPVQVFEGKYTLPTMPVFIYSLTGLSQDILSSPIPLYDLGEMQLQLYQKMSDKDNLLHKLCPFLLLKELSPGTIGDEVISIGPNILLKNCDASFVSPGPDSIEPMQQDIAKLIEEMKLKTLAFQSGTTHVATATEISRNTASSEANLVSMAQRKESAIQSIFNIWAMWENKEGKGGTVKVNSAIVEKQVDFARIELYKSLNEKGIISTEQYLSLLKEGQWLPSDIDDQDKDDEENNPLAPALIPWYDLLLKHGVISPQSLAKGISEGLDLRAMLGNIETHGDEVLPVDNPDDEVKATDPRIEAIDSVRNWD